MFANRPLIRSALALAIIVALGSTPAHADGDEVQALRDRVEQLESLVRTLMADRADTRDEIRRVEVSAERKVDDRVAAALADQWAEYRAEEDVEAEAASASSYRFGGYVKSDLIYSSYSDGDLAAGSIGRDFYIPGTIPVGGTDESTDFDFHARETRFFLKTDHVLDNGAKVGTYIELDFLVTPDGNERVSNSYTPRMRHAFVKTDHWLVGQTWMTFQNVGALAENLDFIGPAEGTVFGRQPMVRYSNGPWQFAVENPETTVTPFGGGARIVTDDGGVPDLVGRYELKGDWGNVVAAATLRQLSYEDAASGVDDSETGVGLSLSGKLNVGRGGDDFRWMLTAGSGLGRYVGVNVANAAVIDANGDLEAIDSLSGFASYRHLWSPQWRSNFTWSFAAIDNDTSLTGPGVTKDAQSFHLNLIYSPLPKFDVGVEYLHATREIESGADGDLDRLQFSVKYGF